MIYTRRGKQIALVNDARYRHVPKKKWNVKKAIKNGYPEWKAKIVDEFIKHYRYIDNKEAGTSFEINKVHTKKAICAKNKVTVSTKTYGMYESEFRESKIKINIHAKPSLPIVCDNLLNLWSREKEAFTCSGMRYRIHEATWINNTSGSGLLPVNGLIIEAKYKMFPNSKSKSEYFHLDGYHTNRKDVKTYLVKLLNEKVRFARAEITYSRRVLRNLEHQRKHQEEENKKRIHKLKRDYSGIWVRFKDSTAAGNCESGTMQFCRKHELNPESKYRAATLIQLDPHNELLIRVLRYCKLKQKRNSRPKMKTETVYTETKQPSLWQKMWNFMENW